MPSPIETLLIAMAGGGIAETCVMPLCTFLSFHTNSIYTKNYQDTIQRIKNQNSGHLILGFYQGARWQIATQMLSTGSKWALYNTFVQKSPIDNVMVNGILSNMVAVSLTHPIDTIKLNMQMSGSDRELRSRFWKNMTHRRLYQGYDKAIYKSIVGGATFYPLRDYLKREYPHQPMLAINTMTAIVSTTCCHAFDMAKRRNQAGHVHDKVGLSKGYPVNLLRVILHYNIQMNMIERLTVLF